VLLEFTLLARYLTNSCYH